MSSTAIPKVIPAQLSFLAIYNPALGQSDETFHDQIVFYYSKAAKVRSRINGKDTQAERNLREEENEKLRQVGLAQGIVGFARSFSDGEAVDSVETHKSRIVLHELEAGWWILASIDLTQLPPATSSLNQHQSAPVVEYSAREVSPSALLLQQLLRAHSVFHLHHGSTLGELFDKLERTRFCNTLDRFWSQFANNWDVLLHGSPAVDIFGGMKLAAGGELGMGVGEEEWGSGEREVLEDYARRTDGLVDLMVSRFGEPSPLQQQKAAADSKALQGPPEQEPWMGSASHAGAGDGVVFSGVGALSRKSLSDISHWIENIYTYGEHAYGVKDNPTADRRKRRRRNLKPPVSGRSSPEPKRTPDTPEPIQEHASPEADRPPGIPPPIVAAAEASLDKASNAVDSGDQSAPPKQDTFMASLADTETWMKYMTLGYGTAWGGRRAVSSEQVPQAIPTMAREVSPAPLRNIEPEPDVDTAAEKRKAQIQHESAGFFVVGLKGDMEDEDHDDENDEGAWNNRILLRTIHVELNPESLSTPIDDDTPSFEKELSLRTSSTTSKFKRLRPVIYVHRPFIYTFLFLPGTESLTFASFYRDLHTYFSPLHKPLSASTSPSHVHARIAAASNPYTTTSTTAGSGPNTQPIYDLVYDPRTLTVHSSIPNIPDPGTLIAEGISSHAGGIEGWSRVEGLNVHSQILATVSNTRRTMTEIERTCKTNRGWWVVWMRLPPSEASSQQSGQQQQNQNRSVSQPSIPASMATAATHEGFEPPLLREAFLVRKSRDAVAGSTKSSGARMGSAMWRLGGPSTGEKMGGAAAGWGPRGLAEGIGIDARRYVEGLLSLNR